MLYKSQLDLWLESSANNGNVKVDLLWYDCTPTSIKASALKPRQLQQVLTQLAIQENICHYFRGYSDSTYTNISNRIQFKYESEPSFTEDGRIVRCQASYNLLALYGFESDKEVAAFNDLINAWRQIASERENNGHPSFLERWRLLLKNSALNFELISRSSTLMMREEKEKNASILKPILNSFELKSWVGREIKRTKLHSIYFNCEDWAFPRNVPKQRLKP